MLTPLDDCLVRQADVVLAHGRLGPVVANLDGGLIGLDAVERLWSRHGGYDAQDRVGCVDWEPMSSFDKAV